MKKRKSATWKVSSIFKIVVVVLIVLGIYQAGERHQKKKFHNYCQNLATWQIQSSKEKHMALYNKALPIIIASRIRDAINDF